MDASLTDQLMARMKAMIPPETGLELPPKIFIDMAGEILDFQASRSLVVRFPVQERYQNPMGNMQGGMIVTAIDNTLGPLSFLVAPPSVTTQLNTTYIRPVTGQDRFITVEGRVLERTRSLLFLMAEVKNEAGKLVAISYATCSILA